MERIQVDHVSQAITRLLPHAVKMGEGESEREDVLDKLYKCSKLEKTDVQNRIIESNKGMMDRDDL